MRIKQLNLIKYGKFDGESLDFPKAICDFHVIVGPNEAGKSTVRNAVMELLFGMPPRTPLAFLHELSDLRLGGVLEGEGGEVAFHRARGRTPLRTPTDEKLSDDYLAPIIGNITKEFFEQMFGLDHRRLVEGGQSILDASKDLGRVLFQSAAGIGSLGPVREALAVRAGELWTKRGSNTEYAQAEAHFNEAGAEFKSVQVRTKVWLEAKNVFDEVNEEIEMAKKEYLRIEKLRSKLERVRRLAPLLIELTDKETELAALGDVVDLPPTAFADLTRGQADLAGANRVLEERRKDVEARQLERDGITTDDEVLALSKDIEALDEVRGACVNHARDLPLRQAEVERLLNEAFAAAAQLGWPQDEDTLRRALPSDLALRTVTHLLREHGALHQAVASTTEATEEKERDRKTLHEQVEGLTTSEVPEQLRVALSDAQVLKNSPAKQLTLKANLEEAELQLDNALAALGRWKTSVDALRAMDLPSISRVSALQRQEQELIAAVKSARVKLDESNAEVEQLQLQEKHFTEDHKVVTSAEVRDARVVRNEAWGDIKTGTVTIEAGAQTVDAAIRLADELIDSQLGTATEAATLQSIRQQAELSRAEMLRNRGALTDRETELSQFRAEWEALTTRVGLLGITLDDLLEWFAKREAVFSAEANLRLRRQDLVVEETTYQETTAALAEALSVALVTILDPADLASLTLTAASFVQKADSARAKKEGLEHQLAQADQALKTLEIRVQTAATAYESWQDQWQQALQAAKLNAASPTLAQAEGAVSLANTVTEKLYAAEEIRRNRIQAMQADLSALEATARRIAGLLDQELLQISDWSEITRRIVTRLRTASSTAQTARLADEALREAKKKKEAAELNVANADARIQPLLKQASIDTIEEALPLAERSDKYRGLLDAINHTKSLLIKEGDGLTREAIEVEVAEQPPTEVVGMLEQAKRDLTMVNEQLNTLAQRQVTAQQAFSAINGGANAATAEAKRQEALAAMGDAAEQFIEMATASRLLKWAIDRYRDQKQGPMLQRAGEVFAQLTLGQFTKLVVDYEMTPPALFAKRENGKQVEVPGLSEGTRDQLFLALRIAALELHLEHAKALPFIADDLFVNFDDGRAKAGLEALRDLSNHTQVVFLTHHKHLLPVVHEVFGNAVNIVELQRETELV